MLAQLSLLSAVFVGVLAAGISLATGDTELPRIVWSLLAALASTVAVWCWLSARRVPAVLAGTIAIAMLLMLRAPSDTFVPGAGPERPRPGNSSAPEYSYFAKPKGPGEDRGATLGTGGYLVQAFTARQREIGSIAVIPGREHRPEQRFSDDNIGRLRLQLYEATPGGEPTHELPLRLAGTAGSAPTGGVVLEVANHRDAIFSLEPVRVAPGRRYAFQVTNDTLGAIIALSVRPQADPANPTFIKAPGDARPRPYGYAVTGFVCERTAGC
jgi:hypothetical protein